jgi:hypothetical protein
MVHYRVHKSQLQDTVLSQMNSAHNLTPYFFKTNFNIVLLFIQIYTYFQVFRLKFLYVFLISPWVIGYMSRSSQHPWFNHPNKGPLREENKLWSSPSWNFLHPPHTSCLTYKILLSTPFLNTLSLCSSLGYGAKFHTQTKQEVKSEFGIL